MTDNIDLENMELDAEALSNMVIDFPERSVQERMVKDINVLLAKGSTEQQATQWVFGNRKQYEADESFAVDNPQASITNIEA
jgi:hypothetical protein